MTTRDQQYKNLDKSFATIEKIISSRYTHCYALSGCTGCPFKEPISKGCQLRLISEALHGSQGLHYARLERTPPAPLEAAYGLQRAPVAPGEAPAGSVAPEATGPLA